MANYNCVCVYGIKCNVRAFRLSEPCLSSCNQSTVLLRLQLCVCAANFFCFDTCRNAFNVNLCACCVCVYVFVCDPFCFLFTNAWMSAMHER